MTVALCLLPARTFADILSSPRIENDAFHAADGVELPMRRWLPAGKPRAIIVALHGFGDYSTAFRKPAEFWAAQGIATFAYDQRGFGGSPHVFHWAGTTTMIDDAKTVIGQLRKSYPGIPIYLLGESMGGAVTIVTTTGAATRGADAAAPDGAILVSPAVWEHDLIGSIERSALWMTKSVMPGLWLEAPPGLDIHPSNNIEMLRALSRDSLIHRGARADTTAGLMGLMDEAGDDVGKIRLPTLVLFGAHEEVLPKDGVAAFVGKLPRANVRIALYPNGYHMLLRDLDGETVWKDVLAWVTDHNAALPSGDECAGITRIAASCRNAR